MYRNLVYSMDCGLFGCDAWQSTAGRSVLTGINNVIKTKNVVGFQKSTFYINNKLTEADEIHSVEVRILVTSDITWSTSSLS